MPYAMQSLLLLLGPTMLAASIYMTLGRLIVFLDADFYSLVPIQNLTKVFVIGDVISFLAQSGGIYNCFVSVLSGRAKHA
jgi:hypothetical protein